MEKNRSSRVIAVVALLVAVVGLSLGFAAFSTSLTIRSSAAVSTSADVFKVVFSSSSTSVATADIDAVLSPTGVAGFTAGKATIDNNGATPAISNLHANFTAPGQKATYSFYAANSGELEAFLKDINYIATDGTHKVCTPGAGTTPALVQQACNSISLKVKVGSDAEVSTSQNAITGHSLVVGAFEPVTVTIEYAAGGARADGDFSISFGDVTLGYSSVD